VRVRLDLNINETTLKIDATILTMKPTNVERKYENRPFGLLMSISLLFDFVLSTHFGLLIASYFVLLVSHRELYASPASAVAACSSSAITINNQLFG